MAAAGSELLEGPSSTSNIDFFFENQVNGLRTMAQCNIFFRGPYTKLDFL